MYDRYSVNYKSRRGQYKQYGNAASERTSAIGFIHPASRRDTSDQAEIFTSPQIASEKPIVSILPLKS